MEKIKHDKGTLTVAAITAFVTTFTGSALNLSIPAIGKEMGADAEYVSWLVTGYTLAVTAFSIPFGRIADVRRRKAVLVSGIGIFSVCCCAAALSFSISMLLAARVLQGVGAAMIFSTNTAALVSVFPGNMRGRVLGYSMAATYAGLSSGPVIGGIISFNIGWRYIFVFTGILAVAALLAAIRFLPSERAALGIKVPDIFGNVMYIIFIVLFMYGVSSAGTGVISFISLAAGTAAGVIFAAHEFKVQNPLVDVRLWRTMPDYAFLNMAAMLNYGTTFAVSYLLSIYLQVVSGYTAQMAGIMMIIQPLMITVLSPVTGKMSDRLSPFMLSSVGTALCGVGCGMLLFLGNEAEDILIAAALTVTGIGSAMFSSPNTNAVMACVGEADYGEASSVLATMRSLGNTLSMAAVTAAVAAFAADTQLTEASPEALMKVMRISFSLFSCSCAAGVFLSLRKKTG